ncbi:MAG: hypothetical protein M1821_005912 [Bathelium mastoideum]|nr:MAG: hypothetical protein M1821_005912 [Bathelium mastoideum]KAI9688550.1 MAG: hypothetical protein M1822_001499 [Bathelium mastoideum]
MGLPIWGESVADRPKNAIKTDPIACARSPIRRPPSSHPPRPARGLDDILRARPRRPTTNYWHRSPPRMPEEASIHSATHSTPFPLHPIRALGDIAAAPAPIEPSIRPSHPPPVPDTPWSSSHPFPEPGLRADAGHRRRAMRWSRPESYPSRSTNAQHQFHPPPPPLPRPARSHEIGRTFHFHRSPQESWIEDGPLGIPRVRVDSPRPISRDGSNPRSFRASALPTPPADMAETDFSPLPRVDQEPLQRMDDQIHRLNTRISHEQRRLHILDRDHRRYLRDFETINGLGDRERSISPAEDDHWETMLSTITPDPIAPSAGSSFTSAAASASFSNADTSRQANSSSRSATHSVSHSVHTSITIPDEEDEEIDDCRDDNPYTYPSFSLQSDDDSGDDSDPNSDASAPAAPNYHRSPIAAAPTPPLRQATTTPLRLHPYRRPSSTRPAHLRSPSPGGSRRSPTPGGSHRSPAPRSTHPLRQSHRANTRSSASATPDPLLAETRTGLRSSHGTTRPPTATVAGLEEEVGEDEDEEDVDVDVDVEIQRPRDVELRSSYAEVERRGEEVRGLMEGLSQRMQELDRMRSVIERMARREDVPEEWWPNVGLGGVGSRGRL